MAVWDSTDNPRGQPGGRELLDLFRTHCGVSRAGAARDQLAALARAFAAVPYENLTKIIKYDRCRTPVAARREPPEVIHDFQCAGAGGTCFSLTAALLHLVRALGFAAEPILADRRYGADTHCALILSIDDQPCLLDPGYLIVDPIPLGHAATNLVVSTRFHQLELVRSGQDRLELYTLEQGNRRYRLTFKTDPADEQAFLRAWDASFGWEAMHYPVLTRVTEHQQLYLRGTHLQKRTRTTIEREVIPEQQLATRIALEFGIRCEIVRQALEVLRPWSFV